MMETKLQLATTPTKLKTRTTMKMVETLTGTSWQNLNLHVRIFVFF
jgi:hypothetical protein